MTTFASAMTNLVLGSAYVFIGALTAIDLRRNWREGGYSHFGGAMLALAFTCGPHHLFHGIHTAVEGRTASWLDGYAVAVGLVPGIAWVMLRVEAFRGGRGDRFVSGTPRWLVAIPVLSVLNLAAIATVAMREPRTSVRWTALVLPSLLLMVVYTAIAREIVVTQRARRPVLGGWSVSGLALAAIFITCTPMHGLFLWYSATGVYGFDVHGFTIDWLGVPAGLYFLWVVRGLHRQMFVEWRGEMVHDLRRSSAAAAA